VVADFDSAPVAADQFEPLGRGALIGRIAADVRACFEGVLAAVFLAMRSDRTMITVRAKGKSTASGSIAKALICQRWMRPCPGSQG